jgi:acyl carrier protein
MQNAHVRKGANLMGDHNSSPDQRVTAIVQKIIRDRSISVCNPIRSDHKLIEIGLRSLDLARLVLLVENEFDLEIPSVDITPANFQSVSTVTQLVRKLVSM